jgi:lauroyl/myristoyl acyltransferase
MGPAKGRSVTKAPASPASPPDIAPRATLRAFIVTAVYYLLAAIAVRLTGPRFWGILPDLFARLQARRVTNKAKDFVQRMRAVLGGNMDDRSLLALYRRNEAGTHQRVVFVVGSRRRRGWNPDIVLHGRERVEDARARGKGVILWSDPFVHFPILSKRALADAGYWAWHLSSSGHGILNSDLANRFLNHRLIDVEQRYLAGRIVFDRQTTMTATRAMMKVLAGNGLISLTNNAYMGASLTTPFSEGMVLRLAQTPLRLAALQGVPLLPVLTIERERFRRYEVTVGPDLSLSLPPGAADPVQRLAAIYAAYLLEHARAEPLQFGGWTMMRAMD